MELSRGLVALCSASTSRTEIGRDEPLDGPIASSCFNWRLTVSKRRPRELCDFGAGEWHDPAAGMTPARNRDMVAMCVETG